MLCKLIDLLSYSKRIKVYMEYPIGVSDFKELVTCDYYFIDKSLFIKEIMEDGAKVILLTRPRRFGKTLNLSMLYYFLNKNHEENNNLFEGLNISKEVEFCKKHQNQYPVIFISFKDIKASSYKQAYDDIVVLIRRLYEVHRYLLEDNTLSDNEKTIYINILDKKADESTIKESLAALALYITRKFQQQPIILIDEYDTPIQEGFLNEYYKDIVGLVRGMFGQALKDNRPNERIMDKAIITGITRIAQESLFSGLNNFDVYSVLQGKYGQYFGFTEGEVLQLIRESGQTLSIVDIREWYNGYQVGQFTLYNPWSIIKCLKNGGALDWYWIHTASNDLIANLLAKAKFNVKQKFEELLQGKVIDQALAANLVFPELNDIPEEEALWSLLLYAGYLKVISSGIRESQLMAKIAIPNKEVRLAYDKIIKKWFSNAISLDFYNQFVQSLSSGNIESFKKYLANYIIQTGSYFDFNKNDSEQIFHVFILGLVIGLRNDYIIESNKESGFGRVDVAFIPKDKKKNGIIMEFKTSNSNELLEERAQEGLRQIKEKKYIERFRQEGISRVTAIGLSFCGKAMEMAAEEIVVS